MILHLLLLGHPPFFDERDTEVINKIKTGKFLSFQEKIDTTNPQWEGLSPESRDLILRMIVNRTKRISAKEIMEHPWLKKDIKSQIGASKIDTQGLVQFYKYGRLKRIALTAVAFQLSDKEIENLSKIFTELDQDGDGHLSYNELVKGKLALKQDSNNSEKVSRTSLPSIKESWTLQPRSTTTVD